MMLTIIIDSGLCFPLVFSLSVSYWDEGWGIKWSAVHLRRNLLMTPQYINSGSQIGHVLTFYIHLLDDEEHLQDSSAQIILHYHPWSLELFGIRAFILMNIFEYLLHVVGLLSNFVRHLLDSSGLSRPPLHSTWFLCAVRWLCLIEVEQVPTFYIRLLRDEEHLEVSFGLSVDEVGRWWAHEWM